jgi:hypothetical protein
MLLIVIILLVSFILVPLIDLTLSERIRYFAKIVVFIVTLIYEVWELFAAGHHAILT